MSADLHAVTDRINDEIFRAGRVEAVDEYFTEDFVEHNPFPGLPPNREGMKEMMRMVRAAFPDMRLETEDRIVEGAKVVERWRFSGTHKGDFIGISATDRQVEVEGMDISRFEGEKVAEHWTQMDMLTLLEQIGALPQATAG